MNCTDRSKQYQEANIFYQVESELTVRVDFSRFTQREPTKHYKGMSYRLADGTDVSSACHTRLFR